MELAKALKKIKSLEIQGAENVAVFSLQIIKSELNKSKEDHLLERLKIIKEKIIETRPTEPCMRNVLDFLFYNLHGGSLKLQLNKRIESLLKHFKDSREIIAEIGSKKIKSGMIIFTHCHSSAVVDILKKAKKQGKSFEVYNTETRPLFQGRITAKELAKEGIKVTHFVDSAARLAIKEADIVLLGADAITTESKIINKIGSELYAEIAKRFDVPLYICTNSWKFDPKTIFGFDEEIEKRHKKEVWGKPPKNVKISNYVFEIIRPSLVTGIISELGIYNPYMFIDEVKKYYPWLFKI